MVSIIRRFLKDIQLLHLLNQSFFILCFIGCLQRARIVVEKGRTRFYLLYFVCFFGKLRKNMAGIMDSEDLGFLRLLQLADSALPIGSTAHSFGLETLVAEEALDTPRLESFLQHYFSEAGRLEATFFRLGYRLSTCEDTFQAGWTDVNQQLSAFKMVRESRNASMALGRRFLQLALSLENHPLLQTAFTLSKLAGGEIHYSVTFGLVCGLLQVAEDKGVLAYLQQSLAGLVFVFQRLLPLGQSQASAMVWHLKPLLIEIAQQSRHLADNQDQLACFQPLPELGSARHPQLMTRLFIS